jgi:hypothetical protein
MPPGAVISVQTTQTVQPDRFRLGRREHRRRYWQRFPSQGNLGIAGGNNITISQAAGAGSTNLTISGAAQSAQTQSNIQGIAASNTTYNTGTVQFTGSNMVTVKSAAGQQVVIDATQTVQTQNAVDATLAGNTAGALALISSGTMTLAGGNAITLSQAGNAVTISNQAMQLGQIQPNFGPEVVVTNAVPQGTVSLQPVSAGEYLSASRLALAVQQSGTAAGVSVSQSIHAGVYTMSGASLSLASSASANLSFAGNTNNSGLRTMGATWNITPGFYVLALFQSTATAGTAGTAGLYFNGTSIGSFIDATNNFSMLPAAGYMSVTSASLRGSFALSDTGTYIRHSASVSRQPWFQLWGS